MPRRSPSQVRATEAIRDFDRWVKTARRPIVGPPGCDIPECCYPTRENLETTVRALPEPYRRPLLRQIYRLDRTYLRNTVPNLNIGRDHPWWDRRLPKEPDSQLHNNWLFRLVALTIKAVQHSRAATALVSGDLGDRDSAVELRQ